MGEGVCGGGGWVREYEVLYRISSISKMERVNLMVTATGATEYVYTERIQPLLPHPSTPTT